MTTKIKILLAILGVGIAGTSVYFITKSNGSGLLAYVPNDAIMVARIDLPEFAKVFKENEAEIKNMMLWKKASETSNEPISRVIQGIIKNPETSGIDFTKECFIFIQESQRGTNNGFLMRLRNSSDFGKFIKNNTPAGAAAGMENGVEYAEFGIGIFIAWNQDVVLMTDQKAEAKTYFANILNKTQPSAKGNLLLSKVENNAGLVNVVLRLDDLYKDENSPIGSSSEFHNPFPAGTAMIGSLGFKNGLIQSKMELESNDNKALENLNFFKSKGHLAEYENALFDNGVPFIASGLSVDLKKLGEFASLISPKVKSSISDPEMKEILNSLTGDLAFGMSINEETLLKNKRALEKEEDDDDYTPESPIRMITHIGVKNMSALKSKLDQIATYENGIYKIGGFIGVYIMEWKGNLALSIDKKILENLKTNNGKLISNGKFEILKSCKNSPFSVTMDNSKLTEMYKILYSQDYDEDIIDPKMLEVFGTKQYLYLEDGAMIAEVQMKDTKTHPLIAYLRIANSAAEKAEAKRKKMEAFEKEIEEKMKTEFQLN